MDVCLCIKHSLFVEPLQCGTVRGRTVSHFDSDRSSRFQIRWQRNMKGRAHHFVLWFDIILEVHSNMSGNLWASVVITYCNRFSCYLDTLKIKITRIKSVPRLRIESLTLQRSTYTTSFTPSSFTIKSCTADPATVFFSKSSVQSNDMCFDVILR